MRFLRVRWLTSVALSPFHLICAKTCPVDHEYSCQALPPVRPRTPKSAATRLLARRVRAPEAGGINGTAACRGTMTTPGTVGVYTIGNLAVLVAAGPALLLGLPLCGYHRFSSCCPRFPDAGIIAQLCGQRPGKDLSPSRSEVLTATVRVRPPTARTPTVPGVVVIPRQAMARKIPPNPIQVPLVPNTPRPYKSRTAAG